jgi:hypothetical protein
MRAGAHDGDDRRLAGFHIVEYPLRDVYKNRDIVALNERNAIVVITDRIDPDDVLERLGAEQLVDKLLYRLALVRVVQRQLELQPLRRQNHRRDDQGKDDDDNDGRQQAQQYKRFPREYTL